MESVLGVWVHWMELVGLENDIGWSKDEGGTAGFGGFNGKLL